MEGRWAQLTVDAHIAHAIDYSKPVSPAIERAIFKRLELIRILEGAVLYPNMDDGTPVYLSNAYAHSITGDLLPWIEKGANPDTQTTIDDMQQGIAQLKQYRKLNDKQS